MLKLLYITFIDFGKSASGSSVRPQKMYEAFMQMDNLEVKLLQGQQNRRQERRKRVKEIFEWLKNNRPDICYIEPPAGPFFNGIDLRLLRKLKKMNVPMALFYRDMYWKFNLVYKSKDLLSRIKGWIIQIMHRYNWRIFMKTLSILYFPTQSLSEVLPCQIPVKILPPGCIYATDEGTVLNLIPVAIYVGGISERYGTPTMLQAAQLVNSQSIRFKLKMICRKLEWDQFRIEHNIVDIPEWLEVLHINGDEALSAQYATVDFSLCPLEVNEYNNMAVPVKIMEYLSYFKPMVVTDTRPMKSFVETYDIGVTTKDSAESFAQGILRLIEDPELRNRLRNNCIIAREKNLWIKRAQCVIKDLLSVNN